MSEVTAVARSAADGDDLVRAARADPAAFARLYETYRLPVYRYLRSRTQSDDDAADLTATTFERAFRALTRYRSSGSLVGWLLRIARNAAIDASRRQRTSLRLEDVRSERESLGSAGPEASHLAAERLGELRAQVLALPQAQRDAIALRYASGLTTREIAGVIGKSEAATQKLISRALAALKEAHRDEY